MGGPGCPFSFYIIYFSSYPRLPEILAAMPGIPKNSFSLPASKAPFFLFICNVTYW
jgi:hypothetical protein